VEPTSHTLQSLWEDAVSAHESSRDTYQSHSRRRSMTLAIPLDTKLRKPEPRRNYDAEECCLGMCTHGGLVCAHADKTPPPKSKPPSLR